VQKRYQVLIPDWLEEYIQWGVKKFGLSFSELIRLEICLAVTTYISELYPDYKSAFSMKDFVEGINRFEQAKMSREDLEKAKSRIYFEARKAIEYRFAKENATEK
jgi:hypothetical protein